MVQQRASGIDRRHMKTQRAQSIYDLRLNESPQGIFSRIKSRLVKMAFDYVKPNNPLIETNIGNYKIQLPFNHELPFILKHFPYYSTNLARIAKLVNGKYPDLKFIDIGANVGDSVALLRTEATFPILCIEGDNYFFSVLKANANKFPNVQLAKNYVGETNTELKAASVELGGTAHLMQNGSGGDIIIVKKLSAILDENPLFLMSKMIKIDTDGFDNKIIRGSVDFISKSKPIIFFEYDPFFLAQQNDDCLSIFSTLSKLGYNKLLVYKNDGEFLLSTDLSNDILLEDLTYYYTGRNGVKYCDLCVFHNEDEDLFYKIRESELRFFAEVRN